MISKYHQSPHQSVYTNRIYRNAKATLVRRRGSNVTQPLHIRLKSGLIMQRNI